MTTISPYAVARIPDEIAKRFGRLVDVLEQQLADAQDDKTQAYRDLRDELKDAGMTGKDIAREVAAFKAAVAEHRRSDADKAKLETKVEGAAHYLALIEAPRARARESEPWGGLPWPDKPAGNGASGAEEETQVANSRAFSSANSSQAVDVAASAVPFPSHGSLASPAGAEGEEDRQPIPEQLDVDPTDPLRSGVAAREDAGPVAQEPIPPPAEGDTPTSAGHGDESATHAAALVVDPIARVDADAGVDRSGPGAPSLNSSAPVANVIALRTHNPDTHFLNSAGLVRLHGCLKPENCGSSEPRKRLCFTCSVQHDGPTFQDGVA
jgi:hypothetical protein